jgi:hypothetical protein
VVLLISPTWVAGIIGMRPYSWLTPDFLLLLNNILLCRYPQLIDLTTQRHALVILNKSAINLPMKIIKSSYEDLYVNLGFQFMWENSCVIAEQCGKTMFIFV